MIIAKSVGSDADDHSEFKIIMGDTQNEEIKRLGSMDYLCMVGIRNRARATGLGVAIV